MWLHCCLATYLHVVHLNCWCWSTDGLFLRSWWVGGWVDGDPQEDYPQHGVLVPGCRAPIVWQGQEAGMEEQLGQGCQAGMELEFDCAQLLVRD